MYFNRKWTEITDQELKIQEEIRAKGLVYGMVTYVLMYLLYQLFIYIKEMMTTNNETPQQNPHPPKPPAPNSCKRSPSPEAKGGGSLQTNALSPETNITPRRIKRPTGGCKSPFKPVIPSPIIVYAGVEEKENSRRFILSDTQQEPCGVGRVFEAQVTILEHKSIIRPGYSAILHIHTTAVEVQLKELLKLIDRQTGDTIQEHPGFIKQDQVAIARFELLQPGQAMCMETIERFPEVGEFTLRDEGRTVAGGRILKIIE